MCEYPQSLSFINLHENLLGNTKPIAKGEEADCLAFLKITVVIGEKWLGWKIIIALCSLSPTAPTHEDLVSCHGLYVSQN